MADVMKPISLLAANSKYFQFRGEPTVLVTSGEHYGAVLNSKFDFVKYLDALADDGLNHTRTFSGIYHEVAGAFGIKANTLAPSAQDYIAPWRRTDVPGANDGLTKFDLESWNEAYFERLTRFMAAASERSIVVEFTLFCPFYAKWNKNMMWDVCPMNAANNINGAGSLGPLKFHTMEDPKTLAFQEAMVVRVVETLNPFDNLFYEIANEPWCDGVDLAWQHHMAELIARTESRLPNRHLVSRNVCNGYTRVDDAHPAISVYQFHYASPPEAVRANRHLAAPVGCNETGFAGCDEATYRTQAWEFMLAGGALFNNLDYSFAVGHEDGSYDFGTDAPGGGGKTLRRQLGFLKSFLIDMRVWEMEPDDSFVKGVMCGHGRCRAMSGAGRYCLYVKGGFEVIVELDLPSGTYGVRVVSPTKQRVMKEEVLEHDGGVVSLDLEGLGDDVAVGIMKV